jgi:hypothetical protein
MELEDEKRDANGNGKVRRLRRGSQILQDKQFSRQYRQFASPKYPWDCYRIFKVKQNH